MRAILAALALAACGTSDGMEPPEDQRGTVADFDIRAWAGQPADVLIVVDRTPGMTGYAENVAANLEQMAMELSTYEDAHIGVISADLGDGARLLRGTLGAPAYLIVHHDLLGERTQNFSDDLAGVLLDRAVVAPGGPVAQPLEAARRALGLSDNAGFRRGEAALVVVTITAGDDASETPVADLAAAIIAYAPEPRRFGLLGAAPMPAPRLDAFAAAVEPGEAIREDVSAPMFGRWLGHFAPKYPIPGQGCFTGELVDVDPETAGLQADCAFEEHDDEIGTVAVTPACDAALSELPCWRVVPDVHGECGGDNPLHLEIRRRDRPLRLLDYLGQCAVVDSLER